MVQATGRKSEAQRWEMALQRAIANALDVYVCGATGEAFVESASTPGLLYSVSVDMCSCPAGQQGQICQHRACYRAQMGLAPFYVVPVEPEQVNCPDCCGCGEVWSRGGGWKCETCRGTGRIAPAPAPTMIPVTTPERAGVAA